MKIKQAGKQFSSYSVLFCWGFYFLNKAVKSPKSGQKEKEKRNETKVDAKQAVNRNESTSKLNFVHGCTHDLKQRAANKRMSRQKEGGRWRRRESEAHMRIWPEPRLGQKWLSVCLQLPRGTVQKRWNYEARQDTQMEQMEIYDLKACAAGAARELQPVWDASTYPEKSSNGQ